MTISMTICCCYGGGCLLLVSYHRCLRVTLMIARDTRGRRRVNHGWGMDVVSHNYYELGGGGNRDGGW